MSPRWMERTAVIFRAAMFIVVAGAVPVSAEPAPAFEAAELRKILRLSPLPPLPADPSNAVAEDPRAARFGEKLFFETRLSADRKTSCATCHIPERAWAGGEGGQAGKLFPKNVPSLRNNAYNRWFYWDGRADSAWSQALGPLEDELEMAGNRVAILHLVRTDRELSRQYAEIFGELPAGADDPRRFPPAAKPLPGQPEHPLHLAWGAMAEEDRQATELFFSRLGKAIAAFERKIVTGEAPFDRFVAKLRQGEPADEELSPAARRGLVLFQGRAGCVLCHSGPNFSDGEFHDVGIALGQGHRVDPGRHRGVLTLKKSPFNRDGQYSDGGAEFAPVRFLEAQTHQLGQFKTPTLRGVAETPPYMHDGRFGSLEEVVLFYSTRQGASPLGHPTTLLQPLFLDERERADLVEFLVSLNPESSPEGRREN